LNGDFISWYALLNKFSNWIVSQTDIFGDAMKRMSWSIFLVLSIACLAAAQTPVTPPAVAPHIPPPQRVGPPIVPKPVYIFLYSRFTDHVNLDLTEDRLRRVLPMIEKYRKEHPEAHVSATILFSGASSEALAQRNAATGIKDFILGYKKRGIVEIGYDGTDEPTYDHRPMVHLIDTKPYKERWMERASEDEKFLAEGRDPLTGDPKPGSVGGLKAMQQVFGEAACITGVSVGEERLQPISNPHMHLKGPTYPVKPEIGDWEVVPLLRKYNTEAILFGLPATNVALIPGFGGSVREFGRIVSDVPEASPELFWADNVLRSSESAGNGDRVLHGYDGPSAIKDFASKLDRSKLRIFHMEVGSDLDYLKPDFTKTPLSPTLTYAYAHPDNPQVPAEDRLSADEVNAAYAKEESSLDWLITSFFTANTGSRFVSSGDLRRMTPPSSGYTISVDTLRSAVKNSLAIFEQSTYLPPFITAGSQYLSLAEAFQVMTDALAEFSRTGKLPKTVHVDRIYGPIGMPMGHGPNVGEVTVASVAKVCAQLAAGLHDETGYPMPKNTIPPIVAVDEIRMNAAQFLSLMGQALQDPTPEAKLQVKMKYMFPGTAEVFPKTRALEDVGATWTFKPAPLAAPGSTQASEDRSLSKRKASGTL
jgi:hypothetical protein